MINSSIKAGETLEPRSAPNIKEMVLAGIGRFTHPDIEITNNGIINFGGDSQSQIAMLVGRIQQEMEVQGIELVNLYVGTSLEELALAPFQIRKGLTIGALLISFNSRNNLSKIFAQKE